MLKIGILNPRVLDVPAAIRANFVVGKAFMAG